MKKRIMSLVLAVVMVWSLLPGEVLAAGGTLTGAGTETEPYSITDAADLMAFAALVNEDGETNICGTLAADIDLTGQAWVPIGVESPYTGTFDGGHWTVTLDVMAGEDYEYDSLGLFGYLDGATVQNLKVAGSIATEGNESVYYVGGIAGYACGETKISNCSSGAAINMTSEDVCAGGITGYGNEITLTNCANWGGITNNGSFSLGLGGIVGMTEGDTVTLENCYNRGSITGGESGFVGGLIGYLCAETYLTGCYSTASQEAVSYLPGGLSTTGTISGGEGIGDLIGMADGSFEISQTVSCSELFTPYYDIYEYDGIVLATGFESVADMVSHLGVEYTLDTEDKLSAGGWPVLSWELEEGIAAASSPEEAAVIAAKKSFEKAKEDSLGWLDNGKPKSSGYGNLYNGYNYYKNNTKYSEAGQDALKKAYEDGVAAVKAKAYVEPDWETMTVEAIEADRDTQIAAVQNAAVSALQEMAGVPTKDQEWKLEENKAKAQKEIYPLYGSELAKLDTLRGELATVWHGQDGYQDAVNELEAKETALAAARDAAVAALGSVTSQTKLDTAITEQKAAVQAVLKDYTVPAMGSGVTEKWDGSSVTQPDSKDGVYQIGTAAELAWFAGKVNSGSRSINGVLTADIDLNGKNWTPIGTGSGYAGTFDGQGRIIHGINCTADSSVPQGLFSRVARGGTVQNVKAAGQVKATQSGGAGLIAGTCSGTIYGCEVTVFLQNQGNNGDLGGITGKLTGGMVDNCRAWGLFTCSGSSAVFSNVGGIVGSAGCSDPAEGCLIRYCENHLRIRSYESSYLSGKGRYMGGIAGRLSETAKVRECVNSAPLWGGEYTGGIAGYAKGTDIQIAFVENRGEIRGSQNSGGSDGNGGILGYAGDGTALENVYNSGTVLGQKGRDKNNVTLYVTTADRTGGLIGHWTGGSVEKGTSSSENGKLWGEATVATTQAANTGRGTYTSPVNAGGGQPFKTAETAELLGKLIRIGDSKDADYAVYGDQSAAYNRKVMEYVRAVELSDNATAAETAKTEGLAALAAMPTQLDAEKMELQAELEAYFASRVYDQEAEAEITALLEAAEAEISDAGTVAKVSNLRQKYLGTENIDGEAAKIIPYPDKAADELYNTFIFDKKYTQEDMAQALRLYETWRVRLAGSTSVEEVESLYAQARKALKELTDTFSPAETAPDLDAAAAEALTLARTEAQKELDGTLEAYTTELTALVGDTETYSGSWKARLEAELAAARSALAAAKPTLTAEMDYGDIEATRVSGLAALEAAYQEARKTLEPLVASAGNENAWSGDTIKPEIKDGVYQIGTAEELAWFAQQMNSKGNVSDELLDAVLTADIDLGYREWTPIGSSLYYRGTFDGQGHTVSGLYISRTPTLKTGASGYLGLFGQVSSTGEVKNLTVSGEITLTVTNDPKLNIGGVAGCVTSCVENCVSRVNISTNGGGRNLTVGGVVGLLKGGTVENCRFAGSANATFEASVSYGLESGGLGGIVGLVDGGTGTIHRCVNTGTVTANKASGVAGILGRCSGGLAMTDCVNQGYIRNNMEDTNKGGTGGIVGVVRSYNTQTIQNCYNTGTITARRLAGGILGSESSEKLTVENCYSSGTMDTGSSTDRIGALAGGSNDGGYPGGLYVLGGTARKAMGWISSQGDNVTTLESLSAENMQEITGLVDSIAGLNGGSPLFGWELLTAEARETVASYLESFYQENVKDTITAAQQTVLEEKLAAVQADIRDGAKTAEAKDIIGTYNDMMAAMDTDALLTAAKEAAKKELETQCKEAKKEYSDVKDQLQELYEAQLAKVDQCTSGAAVQECVASFAPGVVDVLIRDAEGAKMKDLQEKVQRIETAYGKLTQTQKENVALYTKLAAMQELVEQYETHLADLKKWYDEDVKDYPYIKKALEKLYDGAVKALGDATEKDAMAAAMNGYVAETAEALVDSIGYRAGRTAASTLKMWRGASGTPGLPTTP